MKMIRIIIGFLAVSAMLTAKAQVSFNPGSFTAEDNVTLTVDVSGTPMAGQAEAYIWIFSNPGGVGPAKDGTVNGNWTNSSTSAKLVSAGTNKWSFTFTGTLLFGLSPAELKDFGFLVKAKDGSKQSPDYKPYKFDPLVFVPSMLRVFPAKADKEDVVTLNFDRSYGGTVDEQRMLPLTTTVTMYDDNNSQVGSPMVFTTKKLTESSWSAVFIPSDSFTPATGRKLSKFKYKFNGTVLDVNGQPAPVASSETEFQFTTLK